MALQHEISNRAPENLGKYSSHETRVSSKPVAAYHALEAAKHQHNATDAQYVMPSARTLGTRGSFRTPGTTGHPQHLAGEAKTSNWPSLVPTVNVNTMMRQKVVSSRR